MPIDPSIALGYRPTVQLEDPSNQLAKLLNIQGAQQALQAGEQTMQANRMRFEEQQRGVERANSLRDFLMKNAELPEEQVIPKMRGAGFSDEAASREKSLLDRRKIEAETLKGKADAVQRLGAVMRDSANAVVARPDMQTAMAALDNVAHTYRFFGMDPAQVEAQRQIVASLKTPEEIKQWAAGHALSAEKMLPASFETDLGGTKQYGTVNTLTGARTVLGTNAKTQTPDSAATLEEQKRHNREAEARAREKNQIDKEAAAKVEWKQDVDGNWIALPKEVTGTGPVTPIAVNAQGKRATQAGQAVNIINQAEQLIDKATSSYLGAGVDQAQRVVGMSNQGAQAAAQLRALEGALMMAQPRMEGPQSNADVMLYKQMAGQIGDSTVPAAQKKAALATIKELHQRYAPKGADSLPAPGGKPAAQVPATNSKGWKLHTDASGNRAYVSPDGKSFEEVR